MDYKKRIDIIVDIYKSCPTKRCKYSLFWAKGSKEWIQAGWTTSDAEALKSKLLKMVSDYKPDALKVEIDPNSEKHEAQTHFIDVTNEIDLNSYSERPGEHRQPDQAYDELGGMGSGLGALQIENLNKNFDIRLLERDKQRLEEEKRILEDKLKELEEENSNLYNAVDESEEEPDYSMLKNLAGLFFGKKLLGDKFDVSALLGTAQGQIESAEGIEEKGGGLVLDESEEISHSIQAITAFLAQLEKSNNESFLKVINVLQIFENDPTLIDTVLDLIMNKSPKTT